MRYNGLMIDCSRLLEPQPFYYRLVDFMAQWKMNALMLHFADDYGFALKLRGFEHLAMPHAFTEKQLRDLVAYAAKRGVEIIPELEPFGHTRYITDLPRYRHLFAGSRTRTLHFNAIDPLNPETHRLMKGLIRAVARVFPSKLFHVGCDEVDMRAYCEAKGLNADAVWAGYVNRLIGYVRDAGKEPIIWGDHVWKSAAIAKLLRKDVTLVDWRYEADIRNTIIPRLRRAGFRRFFVGPALGCWLHRFLPNTHALENTARMAAFGTRNQALGMLNTIWCPWRYLQNALYYGIAYSACAVRAGGHPPRRAFHEEFARKVFGTALEPALNTFLSSWPLLAVEYTLAEKISQPAARLARPELADVRRLNRLALEVLKAGSGYWPRAGTEIWRGMVLAAQCVWVCTESLLLRHAPTAGAARKDLYNKRLADVKRRMDEEWDATRYPDDPQKRKPLFPGGESVYAMLLVQRLKKA